DTSKAKNVNGEAQLQDLVDGKKVIITESTIRIDVQLEDAEGVDCLPNAAIFKHLTLMGYEKLSEKLTFYKAFFSPQWKFLIHTILQCISAKTTAWNEFSRTMDFAVKCLATNQKFNFSKYIFDNMVKNLDSVTKFFMYPRVGKDFSGRVTPLFPTMMVQAQEEMGEEQDRGNIFKIQSKATPNEPVSQETSLGLSARVESSADEGLGKEDASQQRRIADIDANKDIYLVNVHTDK
nr:hypothetical protein [Tanacetum cinerariifolium]